MQLTIMVHTYRVIRVGKIAMLSRTTLEENIDQMDQLEDLEDFRRLGGLGRKMFKQIAIGDFIPLLQPVV